MSNETDIHDVSPATRAPMRAVPRGVNRLHAYESPRQGRATRLRRRGVVTLWMIVTLPVLLILVCFVIEVGNIWLARVELENALEAAALSAVKEWGDQGGGNTLTPRGVAVSYAAGNTLTGSPVLINDNYLTTAGANQNADCLGDLIFGAVTTTVRPWVFEAGVSPACGAGVAFGVRAQATEPVNSVCCHLFGTDLNIFSVSACATARYDCVGLRPELIRVRPENFVCP